MSRFHYISHPLIGAGPRRFVKLILENGGFSIRGRMLFRTIYAFISTCLLIPFFAGLEWLINRKKIEETTIEHAPVFIIGHWRSGTTFMHNLLSLDTDFGFASNAQVLMPRIMLNFKRLIYLIMKVHLMPKRPMDDVTFSPDGAQEEEFAMGAMFGYGAYLGWYFPGRLELYFEKYALWNELSPQEKNRFQQDYQYLLKKLTLANGGKRLVLKNPANTGRIPMLLKAYPNARFIYLHRDPFEVYLSTVRLHEKITDYFALQDIDLPKLKKFVPGLYRRMLKNYHQDKMLIPDKHLVEIAYEDLVQDPLTVLKEIYETLELGDYEMKAKTFQQYVAAQKDYRPAAYNLPDESKSAIRAEMSLP